MESEKIDAFELFAKVNSSQYITSKLQDDTIHVAKMSASEVTAYTLSLIALLLLIHTMKK